jgi:hypothetical protein
MLLTAAGVSCGPSKEVQNALPYIPASYYNAVQAATYEIAFSYWSPYSMRLKEEGSPIPGEAYRDLVFVINRFPITDWCLTDVDKGYIKIDMIKCYPLNPDDIKRVKTGTMMDIVGINKGPEQENYTDFSEGTLIFKECVFLPAGAVKIPADDSPGLPVYPSY